jgi:hypothetical protein
MHELVTVIGLWLTVSFSCLAVWVAAIEIASWRGKHRLHRPMRAGEAHSSYFA